MKITALQPYGLHPFLPDLLDGRPAMLGPIAISGDASQAEVDPDEVGGRDRTGSLLDDLDVEEVLTIPALDQGGTRRLPPLQHRLLTLAEHGLDPLSGVEQCQA